MRSLILPPLQASPSRNSGSSKYFLPLSLSFSLQTRRQSDHTPIALFNALEKETSTGVCRRRHTVNKVTTRHGMAGHGRALRSLHTGGVVQWLGSQQRWQRDSDCDDDHKRSELFDFSPRSTRPNDVPRIEMDECDRLGCRHPKQVVNQRSDS